MWRVTHIDHAGRRRRLELACATSTAAIAIAEAAYGPAHYLAAIRLKTSA